MSDLLSEGISQDFMREMQDLLRRLARSGFKIPKYVKDAMLDLPVEQFCQDADAFYHDFPVQFIKCKNGAKKSISAPHMITTLLTELDLNKGLSVCQIGSKGGYISGLIAKIVEEDGEVFLFEQNKEVLQHSIKSLSGWPTVKINQFEGDRQPENYPRKPDRILITGQLENVPDWILSTIQEGGIIIAPIGNTRRQDLMKLTKTWNGFEEKNLGPVCFGPLDVQDDSISPISPWEFSDILEICLDILEPIGMIGEHHLCKLTDLVVDIRNLPLDISSDVEQENHPFVSRIFEDTAYLLPVWPLFAKLLNPDIDNPGRKDFQEDW